MMDSVPMVAVTGQVNTFAIGGDAFQEADVTGITIPVTKHNWLVMDPHDIPEVVNEAFHVATTGRPGRCSSTSRRTSCRTRPSGGTRTRSTCPGTVRGRSATRGEMRRAVELIAQAQAADRLRRRRHHEVLRVGRAPRVLPSSPGIPAVTTLMARGVMPDDHELCLGMPGMHGNYTAVTSMQHADLLIALGTRFDDRVTGKLATFAQNAKIIHVDIDPSEIGKNRQADVGIVGNAKHVIASADRRSGSVLRRRETSGHLAVEGAACASGRRRSRCATRTSRPTASSCRSTWSTRSARSPRAMRSTRPASDSTRCSRRSTSSFNRPNSWINSGGVGAMGYGVPAGMGAKVARPDQDVWVIDGDGCFQMTCQELATMTTENIPIKIGILNNAYLGMVRQWQELFYDGRFSGIYLGQDCPDYVKLAEAYGAIGFRVEHPEEVEPVIEKAQSITDRTVVIDFRCDPAEKCYPMVPAAASNDDIIMDPRFHAPEFERDD